MATTQDRVFARYAEALADDWLRKVRAERRRKVRDRNTEIVGVAATLGTWDSPTAEPGSPLKGHRVQLMPGAFDETLRRVRDGRHEVRLQFDHDDDIAYCSTGEGGLRLWVDGRRLCFSVRPVNTRARMVIAGVRRSPTYRAASVGYVPLAWERTTGPSKLAFITAARLNEISFLKTGLQACSGATFRLQAIAARKPNPRPARRTSLPSLGSFFTCGRGRGRAEVRSGSDGGSAKRLPTFAGVAYTGAPMKPDGWYRRVIVDLAGVKVPRSQHPVLRGHDHMKIVGHTDVIRVTKRGIEVAGTLSAYPHEHAREVRDLGVNGFPWQLSIGANPLRTEELEAGEEAEVNGRTITGPITISRETEIGEISFVPLGADQETSADVRAKRKPPLLCRPIE